MRVPPAFALVRSSRVCQVDHASGVTGDAAGEVRGRAALLPLRLMPHLSRSRLRIVCCK